MLAIDTNVLVYAYRAEFKQHQQAFNIIKKLSEGSELWGIALPSIYEFARILTHPKILESPTEIEVIKKNIDKLKSSPSLRFLSHQKEHLEILTEKMIETSARGNLFFSLQIACILKEHGVTEIITNDSDFLKFRWLKVTNPFQTTIS